MKAVLVALLLCGLLAAVAARSRSHHASHHASSSSSSQHHRRSHHRGGDGNTLCQYSCQAAEGPDSLFHYVSTESFECASKEAIQELVAGDSEDTECKELPSQKAGPKDANMPDADRQREQALELSGKPESKLIQSLHRTDVPICLYQCTTRFATTVNFFYDVVSPENPVQLGLPQSRADRAAACKAESASMECADVEPECDAASLVARLHLLSACRDPTRVGRAAVPLNVAKHNKEAGPEAHLYVNMINRDSYCAYSCEVVESRGVYYYDTMESRPQDFGMDDCVPKDKIEEYAGLADDMKPADKPKATCDDGVLIALVDPAWVHINVNHPAFWESRRAESPSGTDDDEEEFQPDLDDLDDGVDGELYKRSPSFHESTFLPLTKQNLATLKVDTTLNEDEETESLADTDRHLSMKAPATGARSLFTVGAHHQPRRVIPSEFDDDQTFRSEWVEHDDSQGAASIKHQPSPFPRVGPSNPSVQDNFLLEGNSREVASTEDMVTQHQKNPPQRVEKKSGYCRYRCFTVESSEPATFFFHTVRQVSEPCADASVINEIAARTDCALEGDGVVEGENPHEDDIEVALAESFALGGRETLL